MNAEDIARQFVDAVNKHSVSAIYALMTEDHQFIDSSGEVLEGREPMKHGWRGYFAMVPDYLIKVTEIFHNGSTVVFLGTASGTFKKGVTLKSENYWEIPAAWKVVVYGEQIRVWQIYCDSEPVRAIMRREETME
ncbi:MAG: nuclear transport factor 2 family protein [Candidatus Zixiibacteriota bacterium]